MNAAPAIFADPLSRLALAVFRCNGALIAVGDALVEPFALTSARWQVLGAIVDAHGQLSVAGIARNMGLVRQSVQRVVNDLAALELVRLVPNPHHRRAQLVQLTREGELRFENAAARWLTQTNGLMADLHIDRISDLVGLLDTLRERLGDMASPEPVSPPAKDGD